MWIKGLDPVSEVTEDWIDESIEVLTEIAPTGSMMSVCQVLRMPGDIVQCHWLIDIDVARKVYHKIKHLLDKHPITHVSFIH